MNVSRLRPRPALFLAALLVSAVVARSTVEAREGRPRARPHVTVELVAEDLSVRPGSTSTIGVYFKLDPQWHSYWLNSGDAGLSPTFEWKLPADVTIAPLPWPAPRRMMNGPVATFAYEKDVVYPFALTISPDVAAAKITAGRAGARLARVRRGVRPRPGPPLRSSSR